MRKIQDVSCLIAPRAGIYPFAPAKPTARVILALRWRAASRANGSRGLLPALLVPCVFLLLTACNKGPEVTPYDYDTREKAKIDLPRNTSMDVDTDEFVVKKKFRLPDWMR